MPRVTAARSTNVWAWKKVRGWCGSQAQVSPIAEVRSRPAHTPRTGTSARCPTCRWLRRTANRATATAARTRVMHSQRLKVARSRVPAARAPMPSGETISDPAPNVPRTMYARCARTGRSGDENVTDACSVVALCPRRSLGTFRATFRPPSHPPKAFAMVPGHARTAVTGEKRTGRSRRSRGGRSRRRRAASVAPTGEEAEGQGLEDVVPETEPVVVETVTNFDELPVTELPITATPEPSFAARVIPPAPRPLPTSRRAIFFDVENTSRPEHVAKVIAHLALDRIARGTDLVAVGNWRVVGHETARFLARQGAQLVHSAPAVGVRDWSDLRIAVAAGVWLASARPGDMIEVVTDDQAFDAVGDVAASLGVTFRRLSYRLLAGVQGELPVEEPSGEGRSRRRSRGGRRGGRRGGSASAGVGARITASAVSAERESQTAPHDELLAVVRDLIDASPERAVSLDALSNALKSRGFRRPPGSPRLITRLRRIKEIEVSRGGTIRLLEGSAPTGVAEAPDDPLYEGESGTVVEAEAGEETMGEEEISTGES